MAEALGSMCHLMASEKLEEQIPRLTPAILSLYKKNNENYIISKVSWRWPGSRETICLPALCRQNETIFFCHQSLCQVIDASVNMGSRVLETQVDSLLVALHQQVHASVTPT